MMAPVQTDTAHAPPSSTTRAIGAAWSDPLTVGGLSLLVMIPLFFVDEIADGGPLGLFGGELLVVNLLLNWPHFMASYRLLYASPASVRTHWVAAIAVPLVLLVVLALCMAYWEYAGLPFDLLLLVGTAYTAWHYAGQTWGNMAAFAHLGGAPFDDVERKLLRGSIVVMAIWLGALWWSRAELQFLTPDEAASVFSLLSLVAPISVVGLALGVVGFWRVKKRTGRLPPMNVLLAWVSLQVWLALLAKHPAAAFLVQGAHALQYMPFVARVESNRATVHRALRVALWSLALVVVGYLVFRVLAGAMQDIAIARDAPKSLVLAIPVAVTVFVNVHHYFTDGVLWKLRNPAVRRDLFRHLEAR